jgi:hypothetical protein
VVFIQSAFCQANQKYFKNKNKNMDAIKIPWPESASEPYKPRGRRLSVKLVPTFADRKCHVFSITDLYGRILGFQDQNCTHEARWTPT